MKKFRGVISVFLVLPAIAAAQGDRTGAWEAGFHVADYSALALTGFRGASMQVKGDTGYGFSGAYNFSERFALGMDLSWRSPKYRATFVPDGPGPAQVINATMDVARIHIKGIYYFLDSNLTPFVEVGYGWTRIDSNILERPPITGCWWDPWWGYICATSWSTFETTEFTYNLGLGMRWDINPALFTRGTITREWISVDSGTLEFDTLNLELGLMW